MLMDLYHHTCEHGAKGIADSGGIVRPVGRTAPHVKGDKDHPLPIMMTVSWFTDLEKPDRFALGLTSTLIVCDRTQNTFRVTDASSIVRWVDFMRDYLTREERDAARYGLRGMPLHWWVSTEDVPVEAL